MNEIYEKELRIGSVHVDCFRRFRLSMLFAVLQNASIRHTERLGVGSEMTMDKGLLWVVARQYLCVERMPVYDERVLIRTWPGDMMRVLFPRYYEVLDLNGNTLLRGSAVWSLMDRRTRATAFPDEYGIDIPGVKTGRELPYLTKLHTLATPNHRTFTVPYSYVDLNGHMNNTRYFDMVEDLLPAVKSGKLLRELRVEYCAEARMDDTLDVAWGEEKGLYYVNGTEAHPCFRMNLLYEGAAGGCTN